MGRAISLCPKPRPRRSCILCDPNMESEPRLQMPRQRPNTRIRTTTTMHTTLFPDGEKLHFTFPDYLPTRRAFQLLNFYKRRKQLPSCSTSTLDGIGKKYTQYKKKKKKQSPFLLQTRHLCQEIFHTLLLGENLLLTCLIYFLVKRNVYKIIEEN